MVPSDPVEFVTVLTLPSVSASSSSGSCSGDVSTPPVGSVLSTNRRWTSSVTVLIQDSGSGLEVYSVVISVSGCVWIAISCGMDLVVVVLGILLAKIWFGLRAATAAMRLVLNGIAGVGSDSDTVALILKGSGDGANGTGVGTGTASDSDFVWICLWILCLWWRLG